MDKEADVKLWSSTDPPYPFPLSTPYEAPFFSQPSDAIFKTPETCSQITNFPSSFISSTSSFQQLNRTILGLNDDLPYQNHLKPSLVNQTPKPSDYFPTFSNNFDPYFLKNLSEDPTSLFNTTSFNTTPPFYLPSFPPTTSFSAKYDQNTASYNPYFLQLQHQKPAVTPTKSPVSKTSCDCPNCKERAKMTGELFHLFIELLLLLFLFLINYINIW